MKTIILIAKNIRYYYRCSRPVFLLFAAGMLCASLLLIYLYGNISPSVREFSSDDLYSRKYVFSFRSEPDTQALEELLHRAAETERITYMTSVSLKGSENRGERPYLVGFESPGSPVGANISRGRAEFTEEEKASGANVAVISESAEFYASGGTLSPGSDTVTLDGKEFTVIGVATLLDCDILIPAAAYEKNGFGILSVAATAESKPDYYDNLELLRDIRERFPDVTVRQHAYTAYETSKRDTLPIVLLMSVVAAAAVSAFMFLLKYLSDGTDYISVIQSVCGAPKDTVIFIKLAAVFLTAFLLSLPGVALHALLYGPVFGRLNLVDGLVYQARDYLIIILISCIASALVSLPFVVSFARGSAAASRRRLE